MSLLLKLSDKYGKTRLKNACQLALDHISQPGYKNIKIILKSNQDVKDKMIKYKVNVISTPL